MQYPDWILERAFGGTDVADTPGSSKTSTKWSEGESMPAAREACELLVEACKGEESESTLVFLVGGAGNGKSFLASAVAAAAGGLVLGQPTKHARRVYEYAVAAGKTLRIVNDATIPPEGEWESSGAALRADIDSAANQYGHLLCCVNRGVLIRETLSAPESHSLGSAILVWLVNGSGAIGALPDGWRAEVNDRSPARDHYAFMRLRNGGTASINVHIVFMDNPSLLEPSAETTPGRDSAVPLTTKVRTVLPIRGPRSSKRRMVSPAVHATVSSFFEELRASLPEPPVSDPIYANAQVLSDSDAVDRWASLCRGAEVISGTHLTYRDVWGLTSLSVTGVLQGRDLDAHAEWLSRKKSELEESDLGRRLNAVLELASLRTHQVLFSVGLSRAVCPAGELDPSYPAAQALRSLKLADPVRSLGPELRRLVNDKLFLLEEDAKPGHELAAADSDFAACWTAFDALLEDTILDWLHRDEPTQKSPSSRKQVPRRRAVIGWYGEYLSRLLSFSRGLSAFPDLVQRWQMTWRQSSAGLDVGIEDEELEEGLLDLAFPTFEGKSVLPIFDEHIVPPNEGPSTARILVRLKQKDYRLSSTTRGDKIIVKLRHQHHSGENELMLDFPLLRETLARREGLGFTDAMLDVEPRIERLRAGGVMLATSGDANQVSGRLSFERGDRVVASTVS